MRALAVLIVIAACGSTGSGSTDASPGDAATTFDAPAIDAPRIPDAGGADAAIGRVACGAITCPATPTISMNVDTEDYCCAPASGGVPAFCVHGNLGACESGNPFYCDQASDCALGLVCCNASVRPGLFHCDTTCGGLQMCGSGAECQNHQLCTLRTCAGASYGFCGELTTEQAAALDCK